MDINKLFQIAIDAACRLICRLILAQAEPEYDEYQPIQIEDEYPYPATLARLKASVEDFPEYEEEYA